MNGPDIQRVAALIEEVAATEIMLRFGQVQARQKTGPHDLVTEADEAAERVLGPRLRELAPAPWSARKQLPPIRACSGRWNGTGRLG